MKAIAAHAIFIIGVILIFTFFITATFFGWIDWGKTGASQFACSAKLFSYCSDWKKNDFTKTPWDWNKKGPEGCGEKPININQPTGEDGIKQCKSLLGIS